MNSAYSLKHKYEVVCHEYLQTEVRILASTLSNAAHESLENFAPDFVVCDESGQCLEGDLMIAMTKPEVKTVTLIGDPKQLPPTLISENEENPEVEFVKRSLMDRLQQAGYPCTMLNTYYRCHPHILDYFNKMTYSGLLRAAEANSFPSKAGNAWESFVKEYFQQASVVGRHRVMISCDGVAESPTGSTSFVNRGQIDVALRLVQALYAHKTATGDKIEPSEIMFISPYKEHMRALRKTAKERDIKYNDNLTVDSTQGQEANVVIYMLVRPSQDADKVGFVANKPRLNVALSRAKKVLIVIGNLAVWNKAKQKELGNRSSLRPLVNLLGDVARKGDVIDWSTEVTHVADNFGVLTLETDPIETDPVEPEPIPEENRQSARRQRSPSASDAEMTSEGLSNAPKRQRVDNASLSDKDDIRKFEDAYNAHKNRMAALEGQLAEKQQRLAHVKDCLRSGQLARMHIPDGEKELALAEKELRGVMKKMKQQLDDYLSSS
jgi:AAA domain